jgi:hypothetical protein
LAVQMKVVSYYNVLTILNVCFFPVLSELPVTISPPPAGFGDNNPLLEAGKIVHESLLSVEWEECVTRKERWFDMDLGPNSKNAEDVPRTGHCLGFQKHLVKRMTWTLENSQTV